MKAKYKDMYMAMAVAASQASEAVILQVGCCIVTQSGMVSTGLNGTYSGYETNCCEYIQGWEEGQPILKTKPQVIHAEHNALTKMLAEGVSSKGATVFITCSPCHPCAMLLIGAQVSEVYYLNEYKCSSGVDELRDAGILVTQLDEGE